MNDTPSISSKRQDDSPAKQDINEDAVEERASANPRDSEVHQDKSQRDEEEVEESSDEEE